MYYFIILLFSLQCLAQDSLDMNLVTAGTEQATEIYQELMEETFDNQEIPSVYSEDYERIKREIKNQTEQALIEFWENYKLEVLTPIVEYVSNLESIDNSSMDKERKEMNFEWQREFAYSIEYDATIAFFNLKDKLFKDIAKGFPYLELKFADKDRHITHKHDYKSEASVKFSVGEGEISFSQESKLYSGFREWLEVAVGSYSLINKNKLKSKHFKKCETQICISSWYSDLSILLNGLEKKLTSFQGPWFLPDGQEIAIRKNYFSKQYVDYYSFSIPLMLIAGKNLDASERKALPFSLTADELEEILRKRREEEEKNNEAAYEKESKRLLEAYLNNIFFNESYVESLLYGKDKVVTPETEEIVHKIASIIYNEQIKPLYESRDAEVDPQARFFKFFTNKYLEFLEQGVLEDLKAKEEALLSIEGVKISDKNCGNKPKFGKSRKKYRRCVCENQEYHNYRYQNLRIFNHRVINDRDAHIESKRLKRLIFSASSVIQGWVH